MVSANSTGFVFFLTESALANVRVPLTTSSEFESDRPSTHDYALM